MEVPTEREPVVRSALRERLGGPSQASVTAAMSSGLRLPTNLDSDEVCAGASALTDDGRSGIVTLMTDELRDDCQPAAGHIGLAFRCG